MMMGAAMIVPDALEEGFDVYIGRSGKPSVLQYGVYASTLLGTMTLVMTPFEVVAK